MAACSRMMASRVSCRRFLSSAGRLSDQLLDSWRGLLLGGTPSLEQENAVKDLLATAIRLRKGRAQTTLPDELVSMLRQYYCSLSNKRAFFRNLTTHFGVDVQNIEEAFGAWQQAARHARGKPDPAAAPTEGLHHAADRLWQAAQPLYSRLWVPLSQQEDGITFLVRLRGDLLHCLAEQPSGAAPLRALAENLRRALAEWFSVGLLRLEQVTWEGSSAAVLEKVGEGLACPLSKLRLTCRRFVC